MRHATAILASDFSITAISGGAPARSTARLDIRGREQTLQVYGMPAPDIAIVSSGDGGWVHLAPHVAEVLAAHGWYVVGFDAKAYLSSFTGSKGALSERDVQQDYAQLIDFVTPKDRDRPVLIGVSEGAGLSVLAGTNDVVKRRIQGVVGLGLPDISELGWRWRDMLIYVTHAMPNEPTFSAAQHDRPGWRPCRWQRSIRRTTSSSRSPRSTGSWPAPANQRGCG